MGRIVHDERGAASLEWHDAPDDYEHPVFRIEGSGVQEPLSIQNEDSFDPYDRTPGKPASGGSRTDKGGKRDLRKLSEWMKLMRAMEERKKRGED